MAPTKRLVELAADAKVASFAAIGRREGKVERPIRLLAPPGRLRASAANLSVKKFRKTALLERECAIARAQAETAWIARRPLAA